MKSMKLLMLISTLALVGCNTPASSSDNNSQNITSSETSSSEISSSDPYQDRSQTDCPPYSPSSSSEASSSSTVLSSSENTVSSASSIASSSSSGSTISSFPPDPVGVCHKVVTFYNGGFTNSSLEQPASQQQFVNWFNGEDAVLNSIGYTGYAQLNYVGDKNDSWRFTTLILGSKNSEGKITFNLDVQAISVKIVVQPYTKYVAYNNTYNVDTNAKFYIDDKETDLSLESGFSGETENITVEHAFGEATKTFSISNKEAAQRVFVHSLDVTYWG